MKYATAVLAIALIVFPGNLVASCPDQSTVPHAVLFSFDTSCASTSGDVSSTTMWCSYPAHSFDTGSGTADYSMTVPSDTVFSGNHFSAQVFVEFSDPNSNSGNAVSVTVFVYHNNSLSSYDTFVQHNGTQGSLSCQLISTGLFSASPGDTIEVSMTATKYNSNATIQVSAPSIFFNF
jgi:hypothetical protein